MTFRVAVVAAACEFPDARTPAELWTNVLHGRRSFRRIPPERLALADYPNGASTPDGIGMLEASLIEGYYFDRERFRVPRSSFERTDLAHWLALDVATRALAALDPDSIATECDSMAVIVANTLTGELSRAHGLRYRWPYVKRAILAAARDKLPEADILLLLTAIEERYKAPFPTPDEDSLAGALSNTIAGRIANHHGLRGGAHSVDGACASSLVAVTAAFERLALGDVGSVLVGAVDLSLDPFELVGFARNGALASGMMRLFDRDAEGFWPGEGCGFLLLANEAVVASHGWPVLAWIRGAAMSTDGTGALTRPTVEGQALAARRAWARAGRDPGLADYFEAHGTGTPTGDPIELAGLAALIGARLPARSIPVGSIKANIGHTKAAAGMAGLLKAIAICQERIIPATTGCMHPHPILDGDIGRSIGVREQAETIMHRQPLSVGVNSFGFGGVNCHVVLEGITPTLDFQPTAVPMLHPEELSGELFQLAAPDSAQLAGMLDDLGRRAQRLSRAELGELARTMSPTDGPAWRACLVARDPGELAEVAAIAALELRSTQVVTRAIGQRSSWSAPPIRPVRIGLMFPGQGSTFKLDPHLWARRFSCLRDAADHAAVFLQQNTGDTAVLQPLLAETAIAGLALLGCCEIDGQVVLGHSFGELPALYAAGRMSCEQLRTLASLRGACMRDHAPDGAMLAMRASRNVVDTLATRHSLDLACENGITRFVLAGDPERIRAAAAECAARQITAELLPAARGFHSRDMTTARRIFAADIAKMRWQPAQREMASTVTGAMLDGEEAIQELLAQQLTGTVKFADALTKLGEPDLILEVGAGTVLTGLSEEHYPGRVLSLDIFGESPLATLAALGAAWVCGAPLRRSVLYEGRVLRDYRLDADPTFITNPCGVPRETTSTCCEAPQGTAGVTVDALPMSMRTGASALETLRAVVAELTGLSQRGLDAELRLLSDLHLNSIRARHLVALAATRLGIARLTFDLSRFANASLAEAAAYLDDLRHAAPQDRNVIPEGIAPWLRIFTHQWTDAEPSSASDAAAMPPVLLDDTLCLLGDDCRALFTRDELAPTQCLVLVLPASAEDQAPAALLNAVQRLLATPGLSGLLVLQGAQLANAFLQSVAAEIPERRLCAVEYQCLDCVAVRSAIAQYLRSDRGYGELRLRGGQMQRRTLALANMAPLSLPWMPQSGSVLLVTGGGRGIGAASAAALARRYGCRLALVGRSSPDHADVAQTLAGLHAEGHDARYFRADLTDPALVRAVVAGIEADMGPIRALLHAAGVNRPVAIRDLDVDLLAETLASKVGSFEALLDSLPDRQLELVIGFGSIIGELGLAGEAHYALANDWLARRLQQLALTAPGCRIVHLAWSAWRETGMAARLGGVLDGLQRTGTRALDTEEATEALVRTIDAGIPFAVLCGRYGRRLDPDSELRILQKHRYLERPLLFYPGIELIAEAVLCSDADLYLCDHAPFGIPLFPLACAIEAMLSAAQCLRPGAGMPVMDGLRVGEAVVCLIGQRLTLRTSALVAQDGSICAELRSEATGFEVVHFAAVFRWSRQASSPPPALPAIGTDSFPAAALLYQGLCFHGPRFQRLGVVERLSARRCQVRTARAPAGNWYGVLLAQSFAGGIPSVRDAILHALQLCVPHEVVLPVAAAEVSMGVLDPESEYLISARQVFGDGTRFVFDIDVSDASEAVVERWRGLELLRAAAGPAATRKPLVPALLEPLIGRLIHDQLEAHTTHVGVVIGPPRETATPLALARALQSEPMQEGIHVSASHADDITVAVASAQERLAIDLQFEPPYNIDEWSMMLGESRVRFACRLAEKHQIALTLAMLYAWVLSECLIKLGIDDWPMAQGAETRGDTAFIGTVLQFECPQLRVVVLALDIAGRTAQAALAIARTPVAQSTRALSSHAFMQGAMQ